MIRGDQRQGTAVAPLTQVVRVGKIVQHGAAVSGV